MQSFNEERHGEISPLFPASYIVERCSSVRVADSHQSRFHWIDSCTMVGLHILTQHHVIVHCGNRESKGSLDG